jgi:Rap1a immunity proteins
MIRRMLLFYVAMHTAAMAIFLTCAFLSRSARADNPDDEYTASEVSSWCQPYRAPLLKNGVATVQQSPMGQFCFGAFFTLAAMTAVPSADAVGATPALGICPPDNSRTSDFIRIFLHYMDEHPEQGPEFFLSVAVTAFRNAYPCSVKFQKH